MSEDKEKLKITAINSLNATRKSLKRSFVIDLIRGGLSVLTIVLFNKYGATDTIKLIGDTMGKLGVGMNILQFLLGLGIYKVAGSTINKVMTGEKTVIMDEEENKIKIV